MTTETKTLQIESSLPNPRELLLDIVQTQNKELLHAWILYYFKLDIPRVAICHDHCAPFDFISDYIFGLVDFAIVVANRSGGKTLDFGVLDTLMSYYSEGTEIATVGAIQFQAQKGYEYFKDFSKNFPFVHNIDSMTMGKTELLNGSKVQILTGTMSGVNCLSGDTLIDCPRDLSKYQKGIPIKDLVGKEFYTYSFDIADNRFCLKKATHVRKTGEKIPVYKVTFGWNSHGTGEYKQDSITGTDFHPLLLKDGTYKGIGKLVVGDRLQPFFVRDRTKENIYQGLLRNRTVRIKPNEYMDEHRFVYQEVCGLVDSNVHVHHKDHNHQNNEPDNLEGLNKIDHMKHHFGDNFQSKITAISLKKMSKSRTKNKVEPIYQEKEYLQQMVKDGYSGTQIAGLNKVTRQAVLKFMRRYGIVSNQRKQILEWQEAKINHKVISVEFAGYEDVYDMTVEGTENFIANGIVVHNSPHPQLVFLDEIDLMIWPVLQQALSMAQSKKGVKARTVLTSTRKFANGPMQRMLDEAPERKAKVYMWCIWEVMEKLPVDDPVKMKLIQDTFKGALPANTGKANGYYFWDDAITKLNTLDDETWQTEWVCSRPGLKGVIYGDSFSDDNNLLVEWTPVGKGGYVYIFEDFGFGEGHPDVILFCWVPTTMDRLVVFDELYLDHMGTDEIWNSVGDKLAGYGLKLPDKATGSKGSVRGWVPDPHGLTEIEDRRMKGAPILNVQEDSKLLRINNGVNLVRRLFSSGRLMITDSCTQLRIELMSYKRRKLANGLYSQEPLKEDDHGPDALRYGVIQLFKRIAKAFLPPDRSNRPQPPVKPAEEKRPWVPQVVAPSRSGIGGLTVNSNDWK